MKRKWCIASVFRNGFAKKKKLHPKTEDQTKNKHFLFGSLGLNFTTPKGWLWLCNLQAWLRASSWNSFSHRELANPNRRNCVNPRGTCGKSQGTQVLEEANMANIRKRTLKIFYPPTIRTKIGWTKNSLNWFSKDTIDYDIVHSLNSIISYQFAQMPIPLPASERCLLREVRLNANACQADDSQYTSKRIHSSSHPKASFRTGGMLNQKRLRMLLNKVSRCWWAPHIWAKNKCKVEKSCYLILWNLKACTDLVTLKSKRSMF